jgi:hypothetical protein
MDLTFTRFPAPQSGNDHTGPEHVTAHPQGDSPFGVSDLFGNVWQYTDEFQDNHTRAVVLMGGSNYRPAGSTWYFPQSLRLDSPISSLHWHQKYFLMDDSYERAGTIGFRCVVDAEDEAPSPPKPPLGPSTQPWNAGAIVLILVLSVATLGQFAYILWRSCSGQKYHNDGARPTEANSPMLHELGNAVHDSP